VLRGQRGAGNARCWDRSAPRRGVIDGRMLSPCGRPSEMCSAAAIMARGFAPASDDDGEGYEWSNHGERAGGVHELSCQGDAVAGRARGSGPIGSMRPPQQGQKSGARSSSRPGSSPSNAGVTAAVQPGAVSFSSSRSNGLVVLPIVVAATWV
jgi:hypothetical protein